MTNIAAFEAFKKANPNATWTEFMDAGGKNAIFPWGIEIQASDSEITWFGDVWGDVTFESRSNDLSVTVTGYIEGNAIFQPLADGNSLSVWSVFGSTVIDDAYETNLEVFGFIGDGLFVNDVRGGNYEIGWTPAYSVEDSTEIDATFGLVENVVLDDVDQSLTEIGTLTEYMTISGERNNVSISNATGATVQVALDATNTFLQIEDGGTFYDNGNSTSFVGGEGNQIVYANGDGISMYNGGNSFLMDFLGIPDGDTLIDNGGGLDLVSGFGEVSLDTDGDVFVFDPQNLEEATLQLGNYDVDIDILMTVFGQQDGNDAVIDFNGGSVTLVGAADEYFQQEQPFVPLDEFLFA